MDWARLRVSPASAHPSAREAPAELAAGLTSRRRLQPAREPRVDLAIPKAAVLPLEDPVVLLGERDQLARDLQPLEIAPILHRVVHRHAKIDFTHGQQHRCHPTRLFRVVADQAHRILLPPHRTLLPNRPAVPDLPMVDSIAGGPLRFQIHQAGMRYQAPIARRRGLQPVRKMPAVARAPRGLPRGVDEPVALDRLVRRLVDFIPRPVQRIALDRLAEFLGVTARSAVVRQHQHVARRREQMVVPTHAPRILELRRRPAVDHDKEGIFLLRIEARRSHHQIVNRPPSRAGEREMLDPGQIEFFQTRRIERRQRLRRV